MVSIKYKKGENEIYNASGHQLHGSKSAGLTGLNPRELLEASLGLCVSITLSNILERDNIPFEDGELDIKVDASKTEGAGNRFTDFKVDFDFPDLDPKYKKKLKLLIERGCTISNTLKQGAKIELVDSSEGDADING
ncbi:OsmC family peroxiredoxin [Oceanispirochaeta crateris]|uniref:OsmC family peroxiredoxin n=1 Tax=Oceanispirochaeta crateris TaxID=2518645 RepID=A0A5C1QNW7_9SPIO|nr:OsmC family protein [Oceanispirochaeta crateris]QEN08254.1 OsmC family peroxiredoxin [Oceanispirochaeta crateris]